jgi:hypothetical protein
VIHRLCLAALFAAAAAVPVAADELDTPERGEARALFALGNQHFEQNDFTRAAALYREALAKWDRPIIRFNLAVALIELDRAREAVEHLERALADGGAELGPRDAEARNYLRLLRGRLGTLTVRCPTGARCEVDGQPLSAGAPPLLLEAGSHLVVGHRAGFETVTETVVLEPGRSRTIEVTVDRPRVDVVRRWSPSVPWIVAGSGLAVGLAGGFAVLHGNGAMDRANEELRVRCASPCEGVPADLARKVDGAERTQRLGVAGVAAGTAILATGIVLVYVNQPRAVRRRDAPRLDLALDAHGFVLGIRGSL